MEKIEVDEEVFTLIKKNAEPLVDDANSVLRRLLRIDDGAPALAVARGRSGERAPLGSLLPEMAYRSPILLELLARGGSGSAKEVTDAVGERIRDKLTAGDLEQLKSGDIRWRARVQFTRLRMKEDGLIKADSPRGVWELTAEGKKAGKKATRSMT